MHALVVLRRRERDRGLAVAQREERRLLAGQELFDHDLGAGCAQAAREHHVDRGLRLSDARRHHHAFAGRKPVGLHDDRRALLADIGLRRLCVSEPFVSPSGNVVGLAQVLGEALGAFQLSRDLARTERLDPCRNEIVDDAGAQRRLGADHHEIDPLLLAEGDHRGVVGDVERHQLALLGDAGIAGRAVQLRDQRARRDLPGERVLAAARAEEEDVHEIE